LESREPKAEALGYLAAKAYTTTARTKAKCGGLSTTHRTIKLSVASVEMMRFVG
jgi:hypothetical protein